MYKSLIATAAIAFALPSFAETANDAEMRSLTSNVLAGITGNAKAAGEKVESPDLKVLVQQAVNAGQSDAYLEALVNEAVNNGEVEVPEEMRTTEGAVDTRTLLASIVAKSEGGAQTAADTQVLEGEAVGKKERFYTVTEGDSLAAISLAYYDTTRGFRRIFDANRDQLNSPNLIRVGQVLRIPR